jgi:hypothetical protein
MTNDAPQVNGQLERDAIRAMRRSYGEVGLESLPDDPFAAFHSWLGEAAANPFIVEANAMVLSTLGSDASGTDSITTRTVLLKDVSQGGFTFFTEKLKARLTLDAAHANVLAHEHGLLTGTVNGRILDAQCKADTLAAFAQAIGAQPQHIIAIGDGANDLKMLGLAGYSVAYRAKPVVRAQSHYALNFTGLDGVLNWFET